mgnify:FL=1
MTTKNWKPEVQTGNDKNWYGNALVFATQKEAEYSARDLMSRWLLVVGTRAVESDDPVNYRIDWDSMEMVAVNNEAATAPGS